MQKYQATHTYCPNPQCAYLEATQELGSYYGTYSVAINEKPAPDYCPSCKTTMRSSCPHCHHALQSRPSNFCPLCGGFLKIPSVVVAEEFYCQICGRRMYGAKHVDGPLLCSEECIGLFIKTSIRICDCCGKRFNFQENTSKSFTNISAKDDENSNLDFCSQLCMDKHMAS